MTQNTSALVLTNLETTYVGQLSKPANMAMLKQYAAVKDHDVGSFVRYYFEVLAALKHTPAWGKPKTNLMINDLTAKVRSTLMKAPHGKSSARAHANAMLNTIAWCSKQVARGSSWKLVSLDPLLTQEEAYAIFLALHKTT